MKLTSNETKIIYSKNGIEIQRMNNETYDLYYLDEYQESYCSNYTISEMLSDYNR